MYGNETKRLKSNKRILSIIKGSNHFFDGSSGSISTSYWLRYANLIDSLTKGYCFVLIGKFDDAVKEFNKAIQLNPNDPGYHNDKGYALSKLGNYQEAFNEYNKA
ncbi:tetratricopeptide repeat protein, partial [Acidiplasma aeolicum]|uniref:tetratricopeptide repeat protein n=1 Tax=Acidiplasma aeolicum TaxID=507754 RepID=UPI0012F8D1E3